MAEDIGERTEQPTGKRLGDAREKGQVARSTDMSAAIILGSALVIILFMVEPLFKRSAEILRAGIGEALMSTDLTAGNIVPDLMQSFAQVAIMCLPIMGMLMVIAFAGGIGQVGWHISTSALEPKLNKLNVFANAKNLLNKKALIKGGIDLAKFTLVATIVWFVVSGDWREVLALGNLPTLQGLMVAAQLVRELAIWIITVLVVLAIIDFTYQRWQHRQDLKMTKQEVKEERKSGEGDMEMKARRMRMARQIAMQRVGAAVPKADVIVTNPTHYAVALKYSADEGMTAPKVVAKGADYLALKMRYIAAGAGVPIVERPPLARALYHNVAVGKEIFPEHYEAVAEVLAYVYRLANEARAAG